MGLLGRNGPRGSKLLEVALNRMRPFEPDETFLTNVMLQLVDLHPREDRTVYENAERAPALTSGNKCGLSVTTHMLYLVQPAIRPKTCCLVPMPRIWNAEVLPGPSLKLDVLLPWWDSIEFAADEKSLERVVAAIGDRPQTSREALRRDRDRLDGDQSGA